MTIAINAGDLRERITLQSPPVGRNAVGGRSGDWVDEATVWAAAWPVSAREMLAGGQITSEVSVRFRIRYRAGVLPSWRVVWRGVAYAIVGDPIDVQGRQVALDLMCSGGIRDGGAA